MENGKNGHSSPKTCPIAKLPNTDPPKVWVSGFPSVDRNAELVSAITENGSPHESVLEQRFSFYRTSHLCVVLHFLILYYVVYTPMELDGRWCICLCWPVHEEEGLYMKSLPVWLPGPLFHCSPLRGSLSWGVSVLEGVSFLGASASVTGPFPEHLMAHTAVISRHPTWIHSSYSIHLLRWWPWKKSNVLWLVHHQGSVIMINFSTHLSKYYV